MRNSRVGFFVLSLVFAMAACTSDPGSGGADAQTGGTGGSTPAEPSGVCWGGVCLTEPPSGIRAIDGGWVDGTGDIWLAGRSGSYLVVSRFDGKAWNLIGDPLRVELDEGAVWPAAILGGSAPNDLWVAAPGGMLHWDGATWAHHDAPIARPKQMLVRSPTDIWLLDREQAVHWDGATWGAVALPADAVPSVAGDVRQLFSAPDGAVWLTTADGTFTRDGDGWNALELESGYLVHVARDGANFALDHGTLRRLHAGARANFMLGNETLLSATESPTGEVVFLLAEWPISYSMVRWDGAGFVRINLGDIIPAASRVYPAPPPDGTLHADAGGIWLRTRYGTVRRQEDGDWRELQVADGESRWVHGDYKVDEVGQIFRWDGAQWLLDYRNHSMMFSDVWHAGDEVWAVGRWGDIVRRQAGTWFAAPAVKPDPPFPRWNQVVVEDGRAWIASFEAGDFRHWDGSRWHMEDLAVGWHDDLAIADGTAWATTGQGAESGRLYRRAASGWSEGLELPGGWASALHATGADEAWVIADEGRTLLRSDGTVLETIFTLDAPDGERPLRGIATTDDGAIWVGHRDALLRFHGSAAPERHPVPGYMGEVIGRSSAGALWLFGDLGLARWTPPD